MDIKDLALAMREFGEAQYPNEACGLVVKVGKKSLPVVCRNRAEDPRNNFVMDIHDYAAAADQGEIIGVWHTHVECPNSPSDADLVGCENSGLPWYITSIHKSEDGFISDGPIVVNPSGFELPYLERPYVFGVLDCWSLVRDYYRREFGITLGDYPRIEKFWEQGHDFFGQNWKNEGMVKLIDREPIPGDLFILQTGHANPNHIAIYIGDDMILHHCHGRLSRRDIYAGYWHKHTMLHLRHESKC